LLQDRQETQPALIFTVYFKEYYAAVTICKQNFLITTVILLDRQFSSQTEFLAP
jgi:hypothetical protein